MKIKTGERYFLLIHELSGDTRLQLAPYEQLSLWEKDGSIEEGDKVLIVQVEEIIEYGEKREIVKNFVDATTNV